MSLLKSFFPAKNADDPVQTRELLTRVLATMRESVIVVGGDTRILASNQAAYDSFGRRNGPLESKRLSEVVRDLGVHEAFRRALDESKFSDVEFEIAGVEPRKFEVRIAPVDLGQSRGAIGIFYERTNIERLEKVRQEFFSNISHELRTPLTSILAFVETLQDGAIADEANNLRFLGVIRRNAERMQALIDDILELATIESGRVSIDPRPADLARTVDEIFASLSNKAAEFGVRLINGVPKGTSVLTDQMRLDQMLTNLIDNAIKFNIENGTVTVAYESRAGFDVFSVADTGEGISAEHLQRIFERFYRTDRARSREIGGTGLGLAIVKHLALLHGGEISVASTLGAGSTFTIELPAATT